MFENVVGNEEIKELLTQSIKLNTVSHSYLFIGVDGIGKKLIATHFAKAMLCFHPAQICTSCKSCIEFDSNNHPDFMCIEPDGNKIKIEQIRNLQKKIQEKPIISKKKVYIINQADSMTPEAQNCLLKTLEEPPAFAIIILIASNENALLITIKSRCMILKYKTISNDDMKLYLKDNLGMDHITDAMLDIFQGSIGKAIKLKDKQEVYLQIDAIINNMEQQDMIDILKKAELIYQSKDDILQILDYMNVILLKKAKTNYKYTNCIQIVENTKQRLRQNANYDMCIDNMLFHIWEEVN